MWDMIERMRLTTDEDAKQRMSICESCEELTEMKTCKKCNCLMPAKTKFLYAGCPIEKWTGPELREQ